MPNLLPRKKNALYLRAVTRSLAMSVLLHALVLAVFAVGIARGVRVAQENTGQNWLELGADLSPSRIRIDSKPSVVAQPQAQNLVEPSTATAIVSGGSEADVGSESTARSSAESNYVTELARLLNRAKKYPRESIAREQEGRVVVAVSVDRDGNVHETQISTPSPFKLLNEAALETVGRIGRFPAPPAILLSDAGIHGAGSRRLKIPISFRIDRP